MELAWDVETRGFSGEVICVCAVGNDGTRIHGLSIAEFVANLRKKGLTRKRVGAVRLWAHYGGSFDVLVVIDWFIAHGWAIENGRAGAMGSLWALDLVRGNERLELRDSARLFIDSVKDLGDTFGLKKLDVDREHLSDIPIEETLEYCYRDCEIVLLAVTRFAEFVEREGGAIADTIAACAARTVRHRLVPPDAWGWTMDSDECGAPAYYGGRVERFRQLSAGGAVFDVNSMYPAMMVGGLPTRYRGTGTGKLPSAEHVIVRATVHVPRGTWIGPLPHRPTTGALAGRLVFPTGTFDGTWTIDELRAAERLTPGFWFKVERWWQWDGEPWLRPLIADWYEKRKQSTNETEKYMLKLLMNSVSGKLIERAEYESLTSIARVAKQAELDGCGVVLYPTRDGLIYGMRETKVGTMRHAAAAAFVLSRARVKFLEGAHSMLRGGGTLDYGDTDSLMGSGVPDGIDPKRLGAWKHEGNYKSGEFLASKLYALETEKGLIVKCKGWPKKRVEVDANGRETTVKLDPRELWEAIRSKAQLDGSRTVLIKSLIREGRLRFKRDSFKRKRSVNVDKRCHLSPTESRPWDITELGELE